jgi:hypothetical protein
MPLLVIRSISFLLDCVFLALRFPSLFIFNIYFLLVYSYHLSFLPALSCFYVILLQRVSQATIRAGNPSQSLPLPTVHYFNDLLLRSTGTVLPRLGHGYFRRQLASLIHVSLNNNSEFTGFCTSYHVSPCCLYARDWIIYRVLNSVKEFNLCTKLDYRLHHTFHYTLRVQNCSYRIFPLLFCFPWTLFQHHCTLELCGVWIGVLTAMNIKIRPYSLLGCKSKDEWMNECIHGLLGYFIRFLKFYTL